MSDKPTPGPLPPPQMGSDASLSRRTTLRETEKLDKERGGDEKKKEEEEDNQGKVNDNRQMRHLQKPEII